MNISDAIRATALEIIIHNIDAEGTSLCDVIGLCRYKTGEKFSDYDYSVGRLSHLVPALIDIDTGTVSPGGETNQQFVDSWHHALKAVDSPFVLPEEDGVVIESPTFVFDMQRDGVPQASEQLMRAFLIRVADYGDDENLMIAYIRVIGKLTDLSDEVKAFLRPKVEAAAAELFDQYGYDEKRDDDPLGLYYAPTTFNPALEVVGSTKRY